MGRIGDEGALCCDDRRQAPHQVVERFGERCNVRRQAADIERQEIPMRPLTQVLRDPHQRLQTVGDGDPDHQRRQGQRAQRGQETAQRDSPRRPVAHVCRLSGYHELTAHRTPEQPPLFAVERELGEPGGGRARYADQRVGLIRGHTIRGTEDADHHLLLRIFDLAWGGRNERLAVPRNPR